MLIYSTPGGTSGLNIRRRILLMLLKLKIDPKIPISPFKAKNQKVKKSSGSYMKELSETRQPLFTELKKLDPLPRYPATKVAKMAAFQTFVKLQTQIPENGLKLK